MFFNFPALYDLEDCIQNVPDDLPVFNVTYLRNITLEGIAPFLQYLSLKEGVHLKVRFGDFDGVVQNALQDSNFIDDSTKVVCVCMSLNKASPRLVEQYGSLSEAEIDTEIDRLLDEASTIIRGVRSKTDAMILWHAFEVPQYPALGVFDYQGSTGQVSKINELNRQVRDVLGCCANSFFLDIGRCIARVGSGEFYDRKFWYYAMAPYARKGLEEIACETMKFIRPLIGKNRKCLVLDCDNTLWGGVLGEDGINGIQLGKSGIGAAYFDFQTEVVNLYNRGVIVCLCSKNNENDVFDVFDKHPDMALEWKHIAAHKVNWNDKAHNIRELAEELNLGLDSMVFMDDSPFECQLVKKEIPEVVSVQLPKERPYEYPDILKSLGLFDTLVISPEDKARGEMYKAETERRRVKVKSTDLGGYYKSLEMVLDIRKADDFSIPRVAQQTQKMNQFNLTTRRYSDADVKSFVEALLRERHCFRGSFLAFMPSLGSRN